jgi:hypothetical protein
MIDERRPTTVMAGGGEYDRNARVQSNAGALALPLLRRAADEAALPADGSPIVVVDYGSATGRNSLGPIGLAIERLRARDPRPIWVMHEDQPENDFRALFELVYGSPESYLRRHEAVFVSAVGRSFYDLVVPPGTVSVGWCSSAAHWLSSAPPRPADHLWAPTTRYPGAAAARELARRDWSRFLERRAEELVVGGRMAIMVGTSDDGCAGGDHVLDGLNRVLRQLVDAGTLFVHEYERMVMPVFFLSRQDIEEPFSQPALAGRLQLVEHGREIAADPLWDAFISHRDVSAFAAAFAGFVRAFSTPCLLSALDAKRSPEDRRELMDTIYRELEAEVRAAPEPARCLWRVAVLLVGRAA